MSRNEGASSVASLHQSANSANDSSKPDDDTMHIVLIGGVAFIVSSVVSALRRRKRPVTESKVTDSVMKRATVLTTRKSSLEPGRKSIPIAHFVLCILAFVLLTGMHKALQNTLNDMRFSWIPRAASGSVVLVAIDSPSIEKIGVWPWPRRLHAELLDKLVSAGVSDIVFDVDFSSPSNPAFDQSLCRCSPKSRGIGRAARVQAVLEER